MATAGLALQVPLAVVLEVLLRSPAWLGHAGATVLTLLGGAIVLVGFLGVNAAGEDDEKTRKHAWEERQQALQRELDFDLEDDELGGGSGGEDGAVGGGLLAADPEEGIQQPARPAAAAAGARLHGMQHVPSSGSLKVALD